LQRQFLLKKFYQLTGVLPIGAFLLAHFYTKSYAAPGPEAFNQAVVLLQGYPYLRGIETLLIFLPLLFHGIYGLWVTWQGRPNPFRYPYARNWTYTLQRVTGLILFVFIAVHVASQRFGVRILGFNPMGKAVASHPNEAYAIAQATLAGDAALAFNVAGVASAVFQLARGVWMFTIDGGARSAGAGNVTSVTPARPSAWPCS
jgi:succinate dehydrogenase / fumarate reductase cytochrome b subunit